MNKFYPSVLTNEIYSIMEDYETEGLDLYNIGAISAISNYLRQMNVDFVMNKSDWPNEEGGVACFCFDEDEHLQMVMFDYKY